MPSAADAYSHVRRRRRQEYPRQSSGGRFPFSVRRRRRQSQSTLRGLSCPLAPRLPTSLAAEKRPATDIAVGGRRTPFPSPSLRPFFAPFPPYPLGATV